MDEIYIDIESGDDNNVRIIKNGKVINSIISIEKVPMNIEITEKVNRFIESFFKS